MNEHENFSAEAEARRDLPPRPWSPGEAERQDMLIRYLGAVATAAAKHAGAQAQAPTAPASSTARSASSAASPSPPSALPPEAGPALVRDVMDVPAASLRDDLGLGDHRYSRWR